MKEITKINKKGVFRRGFTLIELLLVISILGIAFGVTSDILISIVRSQLKTQTMNNLEQQANFVALKLEKDLRNAYSVEDLGNNVIQIEGKASGVTYQITYSYSGGVIYRSADGFTGPLTDNSSSSGVFVSCTQCFVASGANPTTLTINTRFYPIGYDISSSGYFDFNSTFVVRGTY
jgi:prepilin-type N-terminal cleavage/methylation domain-containing protein